MLLKYTDHLYNIQGLLQRHCYTSVMVIDIDRFYSLAVEAGFYGDTGRVIGFFTKLSNGDRG